VVLVFLAGMLVGAALGAINGFLVAFFRVPALVVTLGTMYIFRGVLTNQIGSERIVAGDIPANFEKLGTDQILSIPLLTVIGLVVLAIVGYYLYTARGGRELYAIGSDPDAARLYGLDVGKRVFGAFVLSGALAGLAGVFHIARYATAFAGTGRDLELQAVAAVVIGGVAIFGGSGTVWGAALGAFLLVTINRALPILGISDFWQGAVVGALIIALDEWLKSRNAHFRVPVLAAAIGIYLPLELMVPIFLGGLIAHFVERKHQVRVDDHDAKDRIHRPGTLFAAGLITGEALMGILIAIPIVLSSRGDVLALPAQFQLGQWVGLAVLAIVGWLLYRTSARSTSV
jgi:ribose/xylose/arabinose/galactoside ABC-type transport system permease subunit